MNKCNECWLREWQVCNSCHWELSKQIWEWRKKYNEANEFIKSIAKLLWEDDLWKDWKEWSLGDFEEAINNIKQKAKELYWIDLF